MTVETTVTVVTAVAVQGSYDICSKPFRDI